MFCGVANDLVGNSRDEWKQDDAGEQFSGDRIEMEKRENNDTDDHHHQKEAGPASRMKRRKFSRVFNFQVFPCFEVVHRLVFGAVILEHPFHVFHQRNGRKEYDENRNPHEPVDPVEHE